MKANAAGRACYFCGAGDNPIFLSEPIERRWGHNVLPEDTYVARRCRHCAALYVDSQVTEDYLTELYGGETAERIAEVTSPGVTHDAIVTGRLPEFERNWKVIKRYRSPTPGVRLLDIGCQTGEFGAIAQRDGVRPFGAELSPEYAATARQRWGPGSDVKAEPLTETSYDPGQFSYISAFETLEHMLDPITALRQMRAWLAPDGILAISVPSAQYFVLKTQLLGSMRDRSRGRLLQRGAQPGSLIPHTHIYTFSGRAVKLSFQKAGLEVVNMDATGWYGRLGALNGWASGSARLTRGRVLIAPSIRAIARRADLP